MEDRSHRTEDRLLLKCATVQKTLKLAQTTASVSCVSIRQLFCWVLPFFRRVPCLPEGLLFLCFSSSSLRETYLCLRSRQIVLECAHRHTYNNSYLKKHSKTQLLHPQGHLGTFPGVPHSFWSAFSDTADTLHVAGPQQTQKPGDGLVWCLVRSAKRTTKKEKTDRKPKLQCFLIDLMKKQLETIIRNSVITYSCNIVWFGNTFTIDPFLKNLCVYCCKTLLS